MGRPLDGIRVLAALPSLELFGHEYGNIEVFKAIHSQGASLRVAVNAAEQGGEVGARLRELGFETFSMAFGNQWSLEWLRREFWYQVAGKSTALAKCNSAFRAAIARWRPSLVYLGSSLAYSYVSLALACSRVPVLSRIGDCPPIDSPFNLRIWRRLSRRSDRMVAISEFVRVSVIEQGVPPSRVSRIYSAAPSTRPNAMLPVPEGAVREPSLVYVGQLTEAKGVRLLVQAFHTLAPRHPGLRLVLVGGSRYDGSFKRELEAVIASLGLAERVLMPGRVADPACFYRRALVHVAPSLCHEALGNVVLEAKREGTPSVVFRSGGLPEMIRDGVDGVVCEEKTAEALASSIAGLLADPERRRLAGRAAREDYLSRFGPERFAREWSAVLRSVAARSRPAEPGPWGSAP